MLLLLQKMHSPWSSEKSFQSKLFNQQIRNRNWLPNTAWFSILNTLPLKYLPAQSLSDKRLPQLEKELRKPLANRNFWAKRKFLKEMKWLLKDAERKSPITILAENNGRVHQNSKHELPMKLAQEKQRLLSRKQSIWRKPTNSSSPKLSSPSQLSSKSRDEKTLDPEVKEHGQQYDEAEPFNYYRDMFHNPTFQKYGRFPDSMRKYYAYSQPNEGVYRPDVGETVIIS